MPASGSWRLAQLLAFVLLACAAFIAPDWVWILALALSGLRTGIAYRPLARGAAAEPAQTATTSRQQAA